MPQRHLPAPVANSVFRHVRTRRLYAKTNGKAERFIQNALREALEILNGDRMTPVLPPAKSFGNILR